MSDITSIATANIHHKTVLLRVDYNVSYKEDGSIADDTRITETLPTINKLLAEENTIILLSHRGRPEGKDDALSLKSVYERLQTLLPHVHISFSPDIMNKEAIKKAMLTSHIIFTENLRFYPEEETNNYAFSNYLSTLGDAYVNDAFSVSHRDAASIVGIPKFIASYAGLLFEKEVTMLSQVVDNPEKPFVAILGGSKISTKLKLIQKLTRLADHVLIGGGLANTLLLAEGKEIGTSLVEGDAVASIKELVALAKTHTTELVLPTDVRVGKKDEQTATTKIIDAVIAADTILDIGPDTEHIYAEYIAKAKTIVWNGPLGYIENPAFAKGTDAVYKAIAENAQAFSVLGGGETLEAIADQPQRGHISHISTAGGAMLEFIENGTLPGIQALEKAEHAIL